jgi:UDP:flavonoid glycosyltransferase YjiC (YdhE family)
MAHEHDQSMNTEILRACDGADVIVAGLLTEDKVACIGEARDIPVVSLHMAPFRPTRGYPNCFVTNRRLPSPLNLATGLLFQRVWWRGMHQDINHFRADLGLAPTKRPTPSRMAAAGNVELQAFSPILAPAIHDYGERRPLIGFLHPEPETRALLGEAALHDGLDAWLAAGDPPAFFGFGSMPVTDPAAALRMISQVTDNLGLRALVGAGWSALGSDSTGGDRVRVVGEVNHNLVFPRCRLAVHHGGSGTTVASVSAGLPTLVCSVFADQPFWGGRLEDLGAGTHFPFSKMSPLRLEDSLRRILEPSVTTRAGELAAALRREGNATQRGADIVEKAVSR